MIQGTRGTVSSIRVNDVDCVRKRSNYVDCSIELEVDVLQRVSALKCHNFPRLIGYNLDKRFAGMIVEKIDGKTLATVPNGNKKESLIGRTLAVASIVNERLGIVHNDLHGNNVMIRKTTVDVDRYVMPDGTTLTFPTFGFEPVIIDFGLANSRGMKMTTSFTDIGFFPFEADRLADARRLVPTMFKRSLPISATSGWFVPGTFTDLAAEISLALQGDTAEKELNQELIDLFTERVTLPLRESNLAVDSREAYSEFCDALNAAGVNTKMIALESRLLFVKRLLGWPAQRTKRRYGRLFALSAIERAKSAGKYVIMAVNDVLCEHAGAMMRKKRRLYEQCPYSSVGQVAATFSRDRTNCVGKTVRTYDSRDYTTVTVKS